MPTETRLDILLSGILEKRGATFGKWVERIYYIVYHDGTYKLCYKRKETDKEFIGEILLLQFDVLMYSNNNESAFNNNRSFMIETQDKVVVLRAPSVKEKSRWVGQLTLLKHRHAFGETTGENLGQTSSRGGRGQARCSACHVLTPPTIESYSCDGCHKLFCFRPQCINTNFYGRALCAGCQKLVTDDSDEKPPAPPQLPAPHTTTQNIPQPTNTVIHPTNISETSEDKIILTVLQAQDLRLKAGPINFSLHPYCMLKVDKNIARSKTIKASTSPHWDFSCEFPITRATNSVQVSVYHNDTFGTHTFLGTVSIPIQHLEKRRLYEAWFLLTNNKGMGAGQRGKVLVQLARLGDGAVSPLDIAHQRLHDSIVELELASIWQYIGHFLSFESPVLLFVYYLFFCLLVIHIPSQYAASLVPVLYLVVIFASLLDNLVLFLARRKAAFILQYQREHALIKQRIAEDVATVEDNTRRAGAVRDMWGRIIVNPLRHKIADYQREIISSLEVLERDREAALTHQNPQLVSKMPSLTHQQSPDSLLPYLSTPQLQTDSSTDMTSVGSDLSSLDYEDISSQTSLPSSIALEGGNVLAAQFTSPCVIGGPEDGDNNNPYHKSNEDDDIKRLPIQSTQSFPQNIPPNTQNNNYDSTSQLTKFNPNPTQALSTSPLDFNSPFNDSGVKKDEDIITTNNINDLIFPADDSNNYNSVSCEPTPRNSTSSSQPPEPLDYLQFFQILFHKVLLYLLLLAQRLYDWITTLIRTKLAPESRETFDLILEFIHEWWMLIIEETWLDLRAQQRNAIERGHRDQYRRGSGPSTSGNKDKKHLKYYKNPTPALAPPSTKNGFDPTLPTIPSPTAQFQAENPTLQFPHYLLHSTHPTPRHQRSRSSSFLPSDTGVPMTLDRHITPNIPRIPSTKNNNNSNNDSTHSTQTSTSRPSSGRRAFDFGMGNNNELRRSPTRTQTTSPSVSDHHSLASPVSGALDTPSGHILYHDPQCEMSPHQSIGSSHPSASQYTPANSIRPVPTPSNQSYKTKSFKAQLVSTLLDELREISAFAVSMQDATSPQQKGDVLASPSSDTYSGSSVGQNAPHLSPHNDSSKPGTSMQLSSQLDAHSTVSSEGTLESVVNQNQPPTQHITGNNQGPALIPSTSSEMNPIEQAPHLSPIYERDDDNNPATSPTINNNCSSGSGGNIQNPRSLPGAILRTLIDRNQSQHKSTFKPSHANQNIQSPSEAVNSRTPSRWASQHVRFAPLVVDDILDYTQTNSSSSPSTGSPHFQSTPPSPTSNHPQNEHPISPIAITTHFDDDDESIDDDSNNTVSRSSMNTTGGGIDDNSEEFKITIPSYGFDAVPPVPQIPHPRHKKATKEFHKNTLKGHRSQENIGQRESAIQSQIPLPESSITSGQHTSINTTTDGGVSDDMIFRFSKHAEYVGGAPHSYGNIKGNNDDDYNHRTHSSHSNIDIYKYPSRKQYTTELYALVLILESISWLFFKNAAQNNKLYHGTTTQHSPDLTPQLLALRTTLFWLFLTIVFPTRLLIILYVTYLMAYRFLTLRKRFQ